MMPLRRARNLTWSISALLLAAMLAACAGPPDSTPRSESLAGTGRAAMGQTRQVVMAATREISSLAIKLAPPGASEIDFSLISNSPLVVLDAHGSFRPLLAEDLPSQDRGTWTVNPNGTMSTLWRIRPNAVWHDGRPVTSHDFAFALKVYLDPALEIPERDPEGLIDRIDVVDDKSFTIYWKQLYLGADQLIFKRLPPLPEHILGNLYAGGDRQAFQHDPFWSSTAYVGNGPFRIIEWEKGVHHKYGAFDQYFLGPPKIDELVVRIIPDDNTLLANVLTGEIDITGAASLSPQSGKIAQQESERAGGGRIVRTMGSLRAVRFQHDPLASKQPALSDVRVRRAMVLGVDRAAIADLISAGSSLVAETPVAPGHPLYDRVQQAIVKYPFDSARSLALLAEAGWTKRGDALVNRGGEPFAVNITGSRSATNDTEKEALAGYLSALGMQPSVTSYGLRTTEREEIARFPGLRTGTALAEDIPGDLRIYTTDHCPTPERRYIGDNGGCWSNPEFDRLYGVATTSLDAAQRIDATMRALRVLTEDVGVMGMSHLVQHNWIRKGLVGPGSLAGGQKGGYTWNIHEWTWGA